MFDTEKIKSIIAQGESISVEFKAAREELPRNVYETICAFLNRKGGYILLGVKDNRNIEGVNEDTIQKQLKALADDMNNPQVISPTFYLETEVLEIDGKKIICIYVPESSQPHTYKGNYYDRKEEGDFKLTTRSVITNLYIRKQDGYTEDRVFPYMKMDDFVKEDFDFVRKRVAIENINHPWISMNNEEILRSAKLYLHDERTGEQGYTMAAALLFGNESTIKSVCGHYKIDALCRKENVDRYDDREVITCNLIEAYSRLLAFINKHTPDRFYLDGYQRLSIRELIFREMVANFLVHREYSNPYPARITIYKETVVSENWTIPQTIGMITPENVVPYPKNPTISDFFRQLGWVEDLGSGIRNMFKYAPIYVNGAVPVMEEGDVFKLTVRYEKEGAYSRYSINIKRADEILELIHENPKITATEIADITSMSLRTVRRVFSELTNTGKIKRKGSDKDGEWIIIE
ncbi:MAG: putative DNA binding domain-containing protein [Tannerella sp.]|nr:putative DNA binding domain-containing protein [Tannerella sp.]